MFWFGRHISLWNNSYNCTIDNSRSGGSVLTTERSVEIPLALDFLDTWVRDEPVIELGCVLPYYIFKARNHLVYDLVDPHPVNIKRDIRDLDADDCKGNIISISTVEHISHGDYGIGKSPVTSMDILRRIMDNAKRYFITFPLGFNLGFDKQVMSEVGGCVFVTRKDDDKNDWRVVVDGRSLTDEQKCYGGYCCANTICVLSNCLEADACAVNPVNDVASTMTCGVRENTCIGSVKAL